MDAFGRQPRKTKRLADRPFYEKTGPTSAEIVAEARSAVRTLNTRRPCTPTESKRTLFNTSAPRPVEGRPPSAVSGKVQYEESSSRPPSGRARLTPLENTPDIPEESLVPEPPSTPTGGKPRRPIRSSLPSTSNGEAHTPTIAAPPSTGRPKSKIKAAVINNKEDSLAFCPSPPKMGSPSGTPPSSASKIRRNSAGPTPTPPSAIKSDLIVTRRVRSGPKERISPRSPDRTHDQSNDSRIHDQGNNSNDSSVEDVSTRKDIQGRSNSGDKRKRKPPETDKQKDELTLYHEEQVKPLLSRMEEKFVANNIADLAKDCLLLWKVLEEKGMIGKASGSTSARRRGEILKTLFKFLDVNDSRLVLRLGKIILSMKVTGNNITNICMVIYKLAKTEKNDKIFSQENMLKHLVDALTTYDILTYRDALIYITGALKHLTNNNPLVQQELFTLDTVSSLATILHTVCDDIQQYSRPERQTSNLLIQVTGVLRYLADLTGARELYLKHNIIKCLGDILSYFSNDEDLVYNISRILRFVDSSHKTLDVYYQERFSDEIVKWRMAIACPKATGIFASFFGSYNLHSPLATIIRQPYSNSKLTLYNDCCAQLHSSENCFKALLKTLKDFEKKQEITVRMCFILGNLTAKNDEARLELFDISSCLPTLLSIINTYFNLDQAESSESDVSISSTTTSSSGYNSGVNVNNNNNNINNNSDIIAIRLHQGYEDALVKAIRVIANLSINIDVGSAIAADEMCINLLLQILDTKTLIKSEELVLNTVATLNNLSFYQAENSAVLQRHLDITESLLSLLLPENMDAMVEASRVFGNLTRDKSVRKLLADQKVDEIMIALLDAGERETVFTACGVLINLMTDDDLRPKLKLEGGIKKLIDVLHDFGKNDWQLSAMVCQTLWNYSGDITTSTETFGEEEAIELIDVLTVYLDEEAMFETSSMENMDSYLVETLRDMWEDVFCLVGENLLRRIKSHHSDLVPLESPS